MATRIELEVRVERTILETSMPRVPLLGDRAKTAIKLESERWLGGTAACGRALKHSNKRNQISWHEVTTPTWIESEIDSAHLL